MRDALIYIGNLMIDHAMITLLVSFILVVIADIYYRFFKIDRNPNPVDLGRVYIQLELWRRYGRNQNL